MDEVIHNLFGLYAGTNGTVHFQLISCLGDVLWLQPKHSRCLWAERSSNPIQQDQVAFFVASCRYPVSL